MSGLRRGALAVVGALAVMGLSVFGTGTVHADESPEAETPLERVNALVQPSIVYLRQDWAAYIYDKANEQYLNGGQQFELSFQCTGFVVNPDGYIATAGHCVDLQAIKPVFFETAAQWAVDTGYYLDEFLTVEDILAFQDYRVETMTEVNQADLVIQVGWGAAASGIETAEVHRARVVGSQATDAGDVALLKVEVTDLNALVLSDDEVEVGLEVVSVGYPVSVDTVTDPDLTPSFKDGSISSVKTVQGGLLTVYEISAAVSGGMSGGPTVDLDGHVVGVNSFGITGETQPFNFVRPSAQLSELLASSGVENMLSETTQAYRDGLSAYWDGDKETAVDLLTQVTEEQPSNQLAAEYLAKAGDLPEPPAPEKDATGDGLPVLPIVLGAAGLLVVAGGLGLLLLLRRSRRPAATTPLPPGVPPTAPVPGLPGVRVIPPPPPSAPPARALATAGSAAGPPPATQPLPGPIAPPPVDERTPKFCGNCGFHSHPGEKFCEECGQPLVH